MQNALDRVFYRDRLRLPAARSSGFARDLNSDLDVVRLSQRLVTRIVETLGRRSDGADAGRRASGRLRPIGDFGFSQSVPQARPRLHRSCARLGRRAYRRARRPDRGCAASPAEEVEFWRDHGIYYFVPCVFEGRGDRRSGARSEGRRTSRSTARTSRC